MFPIRQSLAVLGTMKVTPVFNDLQFVRRKQKTSSTSDKTGLLCSYGDLSGWTQLSSMIQQKQDRNSDFQPSKHFSTIRNIFKTETVVFLQESIQPGNSDFQRALIQPPNSLPRSTLIQPTVADSSLESSEPTYREY
jgi:hypothetical protein